MLGLPRHTVQLVPYQPVWAQCAAQMCQAIQAGAGALVVDIQHVGSTAVPGLAAKPIVDMALAIATPHALGPLGQQLTALGYVDRGSVSTLHDEGGHLWVMAPTPDIRTVHLHVLLHSDPQWSRYLLFRDALRTDPQLRAAYGHLKQRLAQQFPLDRTAYTQGKAPWIAQVLHTLSAQ